MAPAEAVCGLGLARGLVFQVQELPEDALDLLLQGGVLLGRRVQAGGCPDFQEQQARGSLRFGIGHLEEVVGLDLQDLTDPQNVRGLEAHVSPQDLAEKGAAEPQVVLDRAVGAPGHSDQEGEEVGQAAGLGFGGGVGRGGRARGHMGQDSGFRRGPGCLPGNADLFTLSVVSAGLDEGLILNVSIDLWPQRLLWMGDPRAVAIFSVKVPRGEPGPWLRRGDWRPWRQGSTATEGLDRWWLNNEPHLRRDAFASINRFYGWQRAQKYVVRLGAIFVDIDCGRDVWDYSAEEAADVLGELVLAGRLVLPSMLQFSGRGLWAFWLLRDEEDPSTTPFANAENRELWTALQQVTADAIAREFPGLRLDRPAGDLARVTRLHGSVNPSAERRVHYELLPGPDGEPIRYSLAELADFYGLRRPARSRSLGESEEDRRDVALEVGAEYDGQEVECGAGGVLVVRPVGTRADPSLVVAQGHDVICLDNLFTGQKGNIAHLLANPVFFVLALNMAVFDADFAAVCFLQNVQNAPQRRGFFAVQTARDKFAV